MKIYEKPLVDVKSFDVEDVMAPSSVFDPADSSGFDAIVGPNSYAGVVFQW